MAIASTTGAQIFIGPINTTADDITTYAALAYTEIGTVESIGEFGDQAATIEFTALADARVRKRKGVRNAGDLNVVCGEDPLDAGQRAAIAAEATEYTYAVKVVAANAADENDTDSTWYFRALVASARINIGAANEIIKRNFAFLIDSAIREDPSEAVA